MEKYINQIPISLLFIYIVIGGLLHVSFKIINTYIIPFQANKKSLQNKLWQRIQIIIWISFALLFYSSMFLSNNVLTLSLTLIILGLGWQQWSNVFSGILLKFDSELNQGDYIEVKNLSGIIQYINLSHTKLLINEKEMVLIPNKDIRKNALVQLQKKQGLKIHTFFTSTKTKKKYKSILQSALYCPFITANQEIKIKSLDKGGYRIKVVLIDPSYKEEAVAYFSAL